MEYDRFMLIVKAAEISSNSKVLPTLKMLGRKTRAHRLGQNKNRKTFLAERHFDALTSDQQLVLLLSLENQADGRGFEVSIAAQVLGITKESVGAFIELLQTLVAD